MCPLGVFPCLPLLLVDTTQTRSTGCEAFNVAKLKDTYPGLVGSILDTMDINTREALGTFGIDSFVTEKRNYVLLIRVCGISFRPPLPTIYLGR